MGRVFVLSGVEVVSLGEGLRGASKYIRIKVIRAAKPYLLRLSREERESTI